MRGASGLRHQLVTDQQRDVFDYWSELVSAKGRLPNRGDLDPARIARQLPFISVYELGADGRFIVRLAGTGFWNFYGSEITGRTLADLPIGESRNYWNRVLNHVCNTREPMTSATSPNTPSGSHLRQFWLRMPILSDTGEVSVLGFDQFLRAPCQSGHRKPSRLMRPVFGTGAPLLIPA